MSAPLSGRRKDLLDRLVSAAANGAAGEPSIPRRPADLDVLPVSYAQQRLWFFAELEPDLRQYHIPVSWRLDGDLDAGALRAAFDRLAERHEGLRTRFPARDGQPVQVVEPPGRAPLEVADLSAAPAGEVERRGAQLAAAPFDLHTGPCWRGLLARVGDGTHRLTLVFHHIVFDGWSMEVLQRDVAAFYRAELGQGTPPAPLAISYADYALWEREQLAAGRLDSLLEYWRERLRGAPHVLELRTDRPRPERVDNTGAVANRAGAPGLRDRVRALCAEEQATPFMVLLAAFGLVLCRYARVPEVVLGSVVANRSRREVEDLVGFFVNTVLLRVASGRAGTFRAAVREARAVALGAFAHADLPLDTIVEDQRPPRDLSRNPLFQVLFTYLPDRDGTGWDLPGVDTEPVDPVQDTAQFDLTLVVRERGSGYDASLNYATALFDAATVERLLGHFHWLLEAGLDDPDGRLDEIPLATPSELRALERLQGPRRERREVTLHDAIAAQARRTPDAVALVEGDRALTYAELEAEADALARHLHAAGAGQDQPVGICLPRSLEMVVGVLAILKAGGGYLPIDPDAPRARMEHMLREAGARVCLTDRAHRERLPPGAAVYVALDELGPPPQGVMLPPGDPDGICGVYFTSGSTGRPKGVACHHRGWFNLLWWEVDRMLLGPGAVMLLKTTLTFDPSTMELFPPLLSGATLAIGGPDVHRDPAALAEALRRYRVTAFGGVPSLMALLVHEVAERGIELPDLRWLYSGGEALSAGLARRLVEVLGRWGCVVDNQWGPTETSVVSAAYRVEPGADPSDVVAIGQPVDNVVVHVLDDALQPLPPGVPGELYVSGVAVTRGYVNQPALTAQVFLPDPLATEPGTRMYRTGDLGCRRPDGTIDFLGRTDHQVKVHGVRIELGEVEAVAERHPWVKRAVVVLRAERLAAYVELTAAAEPAAAADVVDAHLREFLPEVMVPATVTVLDGMPIGPSGKIDRGALPDPDVDPPAGGYVAPSTPLEAWLCALWGDVLGVKRVGVHDDFFGLGGHSLSAVRLIGAVRRREGQDLPLSLLFEAPTVAEFAARLGAGAGRGVVALAGGPAAPPLVLAHPVGGTVFCYRALAAELDGSRSVWGLEAPVGASADLSELAGRHVAALTAAQPQGPYALGGWSLGGVLAYEVARRLAAAGHEVADVWVLDALPPVVPEARAELRAILRRLERLVRRVEALEAGQPVDAGLVTQVADLLANFGIEAAALAGHDRDDVAGVLRGWHANTAAFAAYEPRPADVRVRLLVADEHDAATVREMAATWKRLARGGCTVDMVGGTHVTLLQPGYVEEVATHLRRGFEESPVHDRKREGSTA